MQQIPCPDGYLLDSQSSLSPGHQALNTYLLRWEEAGWKVATKELNSIRDKRIKVQTWMALLDRLEHNHKNGTAYFQRLHDLTYAIETWKLTLTEAELIAILRHTARLAGIVTPYAPMPHLMAYVEEHGLTQELATAIREFTASVHSSSHYVNQTRAQLLNSRLDMLAWRDEWTPIDLKRCWSEQIRADYRATTSPAREHWRRILHSIDGDEGVHPAPKWLERSRVHIDAIGTSAFRDQLLGWFAPLKKGQKQRLSREGSYLLRSIIWLAESLHDPEIQQKLAEIPGVDFTPKKNGDKVQRAAAEAIGIANPTAIPPQPAPGLDHIMREALAKALTPGVLAGVPPEFADRIRPEGDIVSVRGDLDTYRVNLVTGAISRQSDGRSLRVSPGDSPLTSAPFARSLMQIILLAQDSRNVHLIDDTGW
jgi:hypothetical protein